MGMFLGGWGYAPGGHGGFWGGGLPNARGCAVFLMWVGGALRDLRRTWRPEPRAF